MMTIVKMVVIVCILNSDAEKAEEEVTFLHLHGPSQSYKYLIC